MKISGENTLTASEALDLLNKESSTYGLAEERILEENYFRVRFSIYSIYYSVRIENDVLYLIPCDKFEILYTEGLEMTSRYKYDTKDKINELIELCGLNGGSISVYKSVRD